MLKDFKVRLKVRCFLEVRFNVMFGTTNLGFIFFRFEIPSFGMLDVLNYHELQS